MNDRLIFYTWAAAVSTLSLLLSSCAPSHPTVTDPQREAFENANMIVIHTADDPETAFDEMIRILHQYGYRIASTDPYRLQVGTIERTLSGSAGILGRRLLVNIGENEQTWIQITGRYNLQDRRGSRVASNRRISYSDTAPQILREMWEEMNQIAFSYDQGEVLFVRH